MSRLFRFLHILRLAALAGALSWAAAANAESVDITATGSTGVAGGAAFAEIVYDFGGPYPLLSLDLLVAWDAAVLSWDADNTTVSYDGDTTRIDDLIDALNQAFGQDSVMLTPAADSFALSLIAATVPQLDGPVRLHIAFDIAGNAQSGATIVQFSGEVARDIDTLGAEYSAAATIGVNRNGTLPLPGSAALVAAAGLAALAARGRRSPVSRAAESEVTAA